MKHWFERFYGLFDEKNDSGSGAGAGDKGKSDDKKSDEGSDLAKENADLKARLAKFESKNKDEDNNNTDDLAERARKERETKDKQGADHKAIESAITFNLQKEDFLKQNVALLPESVKDLFSTADKETYDSPVQKASEIKSGLIQEFFKVQSNVDVLTASQKTALADFLKLTKDGKREKAQTIYDNIFEPAIGMLKAIKKTEEVNRARNGYGDGSDSAYKEKLISHSRQHYLGEKKNA